MIFTGNLKVAIKRVEELQSKRRVDKGMLNGALMNIAESLVYFKDYTDQDKERAERILAKHNINVELTPEGLEKAFKELRVSGTFSELCLKCGRKLKNPTSKEKGMGPVCRKKSSPKVKSLI